MNGDRMRIVQLFALMILIGVQISFANGKIEIGTRIQPIMQFDERGDFTDSGKLSFAMDALRLQSHFSRSFDSFELDAELEYDPSEGDKEMFLKDGWVKITIKDQLGLKAGFMKRAVVGQHEISSKLQRSISRSHMAQYCREFLTPRQVGVTLFTNFWQGKIGTAFSLFDPQTEEVNGVTLKDFTDNPMVELSVAPVEEVALRYGLAAPQFGSSMAGGGHVTTRVYIHSLSLQLQPWERIGLFLDASLGADSSGVEDLAPHVTGLKEAVHKSFYIEPRFDFSIKEKLKLQLTPTVELLSLYELGTISFEKSDTRFALALAARFFYGKRFSFDAEWRNLFEEGFSSTKSSTVALRLTYQDLFKLKLREKKSEVR